MMELELPEWVRGKYTRDELIDATLEMYHSGEGGQEKRMRGFHVERVSNTGTFHLPGSGKGRGSFRLGGKRRGSQAEGLGQGRRLLVDGTFSTLVVIVENESGPSFPRSLAEQEAYVWGSNHPEAGVRTFEEEWVDVSHG